MLALVADDRPAQKVLAVWLSMARGKAVPDDDVIATRCVVLGVASKVDAARAAARLRAAGLLTPDGTTDLGERWLQTIAANLTGTSRSKKKK